jgi:AcrR family transcriptional regulator
MTRKPYSSPARAAAADRTRGEIVAAAAGLLREPAGAEPFSLESVGKTAGVSRLTVYNHFGSRRALLEAVFDDIAERAGLTRLAEAASDPDPHRGLARLISIFCDFWAAESGAHGRIQAARASDAELDAALEARNQRRKRLLQVITGRLLADAPSKARDDLVDSLYVLTSLPVFAGLARERGEADARRLIEAMASDALRRAGA